MHNDQNTRKTVSAGNLVGRAFFICLAFLIIPLLIHSFFQYRKEIELERQEIQQQEQDVRAILLAIGEQMVQRIADVAALDWAVLTTPTRDDSFGDLFDVRRISVEPAVADQFAMIDEAEEALLIGRKTSETTANVIVHKVAGIIALKNPPFPIQIAVNNLLSDRFIEEIAVPNTELYLHLGTDYLGISHVHPDHFFFRIVTFMALVSFLGGGSVFLLLKKLAKPLNVLRLTMARVADGAIYSRYVSQSFGFEINAIGQYFNETVDALISYQKQAEIEKIQRERLAEKFQLAHTIQADLLPKKIPRAPQLDIGAVYLPAMEVGGDFYDVLVLSNGKILLLVSDIADKGISACLFSLGLRSSFRALAEASGGDVAEIIKKANDLFLLDAEETSQFATVWFGVLEGKMLSYLCLGHPPALFKRNGVITELATFHPSLGLFPFQELTASTLELQSGDELLIFSDGVTEAHDPESLLFGKARLKDIFSKSSLETAEVFSFAIAEEIQAFSQGAEQHDDITILVVKVR